MLCHVTHYIYLQKLGKLGEGQFVAARYYYTFNLLLKTYIKLFEKIGVIASKSSVVGDMKEDTNEKLCLPMEKPPPPPGESLLLEEQYCICVCLCIGGMY